MNNYTISLFLLFVTAWLGTEEAVSGQPAPTAANATAPAAAPTTAAPSPMAIRAMLNPQPAPGAMALPGAAGVLLSGYGQQAQEGLILSYFAAGTLADALSAGSLSSTDARHQADSYLALATSARDDLRRVRNAYALDTAELDELDKLVAAYGDVIPMIESAQRLVAAPTDPDARAACQAARRKAFATLSALFNWQ
ncbi:MAG: hypothetical protein ABSH19_02855 [Opitutales bacterium]|jgi:hypothetical protein